MFDTNTAVLVLLVVLLGDVDDFNVIFNILGLSLICDVFKRFCFSRGTKRGGLNGLNLTDKVSQKRLKPLKSKHYEILTNHDSV